MEQAASARARSVRASDKPGDGGRVAAATRRRWPALLASCSLLAVAACSKPGTVHTDAVRSSAPYNEVPVSTNFPTTTQLQLQAARHWASIADDTGKAIAALLRKGSTCAPAPRACETVTINPPSQVTAFSRAFHGQLTTTLVASGLSVSKGGDAAVAIDIDVQPVSFGSNRPQYRHAGAAVELGPGIWALRDVATLDPGDPAKTPPTPDALHWFRSEFAAGQTPATEILVTVSAGTKTRYLARSTNVYYVTEGDHRLYDQEICSLIQPCAASPQRTRSIGITGDCPLDQPCCPAAGRPCAEDEAKAKTAKGRK